MGRFKTTGITKESIIDQTCSPKSPLTPLFQRGEFLPFVKGEKEGFRLWCLYNYGLIKKSLPCREMEAGLE
jgi:hypothetical protein